MAALALQLLVQRVSLLLVEPTAATHHTPPAPRLRLLLLVVISYRGNCHPDECGFQAVLTVAAKSLQP